MMSRRDAGIGQLQQLLEGLRSHNHERVQASLLTLREAGWLTDGTLIGVSLVSADLTGANLWAAKLREADLSGAILREANLTRACLAAADLRDADLRNANLWGTDLQRATLCQANLRGANVQGVNLSGADLRGVDMAGLLLDSRYLGKATYSSDTRLPDGILWSRNIDMERYTNPAHPDFWQPDCVRG